MATYYMFGKYTPEALKGIGANRTKEASGIIQKLGGKILSMHALIGNYDLVLVVQLPGTEQLVKASLALTKLSGISFSTSEALSVEQFDQLSAGI